MIGLAVAFVIATAGSPDTVASAALYDARALVEGFEAGGAIYQCGAGYAYSAPVTDHKRDSVRIPVVTFDADACKLVAFYHTHPKGDARFSREDIAMACKAHVPSYILPMGASHMRRFDCTGLPASVAESAYQHPVLSKGDEV